MSTVVNRRSPPNRLPPDDSDEALMARYRDQDDIQAFETVVHRYEKPLYNYLLRYLGDRQLAEDVFQAAFFRIHEKRALFTREKRFRPWLYTIAHHLAIDALRKEGRHWAVSLDKDRSEGDAGTARLLDQIQSHTPSPLEEAEAQERRDWTHRAIDALPDHLRATLLLVYFQGLKYQEAAEVLHVPVGTVKSRLHQALLQLNAALRNEHETR
jgi:RNA polymerase sigma-70 factor (ECF subfamily)